MGSPEGDLSHDENKSPSINLFLLSNVPRKQKKKRYLGFLFFLTYTNNGTGKYLGWVKYVNDLGVSTLGYNTVRETWDGIWNDLKWIVVGIRDQTGIKDKGNKDLEENLVGWEYETIGSSV